MFIVPAIPAEVKPIIAVTAAAQPGVADAGEYRPSIGPDFIPTAEQEAWFAAFQAALDGEQGVAPFGSGWGRDRIFAFTRGTAEGHRRRAIVEAGKLGRAMGLDDSIGEPPAGFSDEEKAAYREGFQGGLDERQGRIEFEEWLDSLAPEPDWDSMYPDFDPHHPAERAEVFGTGATMLHQV